MAIWLETGVLALCAYALGLGGGWLLWHRSASGALERDEEDAGGGDG